MSAIDIFFHVVGTVFSIYAFICIASFIAVVGMIMEESREEEKGMKLFKSVEDKLKEIGWTMQNNEQTFIRLFKKDKIKHGSTYVELYSSGEIASYTCGFGAHNSEKLDTILTYEDYRLLLKLMKKRGWPSIG